jgi:BirA family biotin operon repressor/biotin-[acetyl-CoA-carboxylase] ligase
VTIALGEAARADGFTLVHLPSVGSTNHEAMALDRGDRIWMVADEQTSGRGRRGRDWASPRGNLYASLRLEEAAPARSVAQLCFVAAVALSDAVERVAPVSAASLRLKWPNDLLVDGAKVAGILIEGSHGPSGLVTVVGCGVNVASHPSDTPYPATALVDRDPDASPAALFMALSDCFAARLSQWHRGERFSTIRDAWLQRAAGLGAPIVVRLPDGDISGRFEALDEDGRLILADGGQRRAISAGEVFLSAHSRTSGGT